MQKVTVVLSEPLISILHRSDYGEMLVCSPCGIVHLLSHFRRVYFNSPVTRCSGNSLPGTAGLPAGGVPIIPHCHSLS